MSFVTVSASPLMVRLYKLCLPDSLLRNLKSSIAVKRIEVFL